MDKRKARPADASSGFLLSGRGERIRTSGLYVPNNEDFGISCVNKGFLTFVLQYVLHSEATVNAMISYIANVSALDLVGCRAGASWAPMETRRAPR